MEKLRTKGRQTGVYLGQELELTIKILAIARKTTISDIVRQSLDRYFELPENNHVLESVTPHLNELKNSLA